MPASPPPPEPQAAPPSRWRWYVAAVAIAALGVVAAGVAGRTLVSRFFPITHDGVVQRVGVVQNIGRVAPGEAVRTFAILFEDGFVCESTTAAFAAVREGDRIHLRGYHDVSGWPVADPGWWRCVDAQLVNVDAPR